MPFLIEDLTTTLIQLIVGVVLAVGVIALISVRRRIVRQRYFQQLDLSRQKVRELVEPLYQRPGADLKAAIARLQRLRSKADHYALEEVFLQRAKIPEDLDLTRALVKGMGWTDEWIDVVRSRDRKPSGAAARLLEELHDAYRPPALARRVRLFLTANFTARCQAATRLALIPTPEGLLALIAGLGDPHRDVQEICLRYLGQIGDPVTIPVVAEELIKVLEQRSQQSVRNAKTALVQFSLEDVGALSPLLEHPNRRIRFFATDIIREITERQAAQEVLSKNDFSPEIHRLFTEQLAQDEWGDVRARAAAVIGHFRDSVSSQLLAKLLSDKEWFVRLHACRAAASRFYVALAPGVVQCLTDSHWLVREAATRALVQMGDLGIESMIRVLASGQDRYSAEQVCEELQRSGLLIALLEHLGARVSTTPVTGGTLSVEQTLTLEEEQNWQALAVVRRMISLGKVAMLLGVLRSPIRMEQKLALIRELALCLTPECLETLRQTAEEDPDPQVRRSALAAFQKGLAQAEAQTAPAASD